MKFIPVFFLFLLASCNDTVRKKPDLQITIKKDTTFVKATASNPYSPVDISAMDISYFPVDYPVLKMSKKITGPPLARVIYSRPLKQGRKIFGSLLKFGEPWRLGANEATEIEFFQPVVIQNKKIDKGRYVLYAIPEENSWTIVFNSNTFTWGLKQDASKDLYKFQIPIQHTDTAIEHFTMVFEKATNGANLLMAWDEVAVRLPIKFT
jgi:hypothetical protein